MKGFENIFVWYHGTKNVVSYKGQHYVLNGKRTTKAAICKKFEMAPSELDRYIGGGFKKKEAFPNTNIVSVKRYLNDVQDFIAGFGFVLVLSVYVISMMLIMATRDNSVIYFLISGTLVSAGFMVLSDELEKLPTSVTDFLCGVKRVRI